MDGPRRVGLDRHPDAGHPIPGGVTTTAFVLLLILVGPAATPAVGPAVDPTSLRFDGAAALEHVRVQVGYGPRIPDTSASNATIAYITEGLRAAGWNVSLQAFTGTEGDGLRVHFTNVVADRLAANRTGGGGGGPPKVLLLGAHFDTRPFTDHDSAGNSIPPDRTRPIDGANDGGSGVAVLLELARAIENRTYQLDLRLIFFDGEDYGTTIRSMFYGSRYYVAELSTEEKLRTKGLILLDMVGDADLRLPRERQSTQSLVDEVWAVARSINATAFKNETGPSIYDDHSQFLSAGIPAIDIIDFDYPNEQTNYWHTPEDTLDKVSAASLEQVGRVMEAYLEGYRAGSVPPPDGPPPVVVDPYLVDRILAVGPLLVVAGGGAALVGALFLAARSASRRAVPAHPPARLRPPSRPPAAAVRRTAAGPRRNVKGRR